MTTDSTKEHLLPPSMHHLFFIRALVFVILVVAFDLWLVRHTGYGLGDPRVIGGIGGVIFFAFSLFKGVISTADEERWKIILSRIIGAVLDFRFLAGLCAIVVFAMLTISSVTIIAGSDDLGRKAVLQSVDRMQDGIKMGLNSQAVRRWVWVSPFGRIYRVLLDGYLPGSIEVYPLLGTTIHPERDLRRSPTILIRPSIKALQSLKQCEDVESPPDAPVKRCGWFRLRGIDNFEKCMEIERVEGHSSSFLIGWPQAMPQGILQDWKLELTILGTAQVPGIEAETIMAWKEPKLMAPDCPPKVGATLRAEVYTKSGEKEIVAGKTFRVTNTPFIDVLMETVTQTGETSNEN